MDDYSTKIKNSAEHLIRNEFPEKALELDTLVSVGFGFPYENFYLVMCFRVRYYHSVKCRKFERKFNYQHQMILSHI